MIATGKWADPARGKITFKEWSDLWLSTVVHLKTQTREGYEKLLKNRVLPWFGDSQLRRTARVAVQAWVNEMIADGLSASQVRQSRQVMFAIMELALDEGIVVKNPVKGVKAPRDKKREAVFLSAEEVHRLAEAAEDRRPGSGGVIVFTLAYTGMRWGELAAVRRSRCDLLHSRLIVSESMAEVKGGVEFGPTKTYRNRAIPLAPFLVQLLTEHLAHNVSVEPDALVFTAQGGGPLHYSNMRARMWKPAIEDAGLSAKITPHSLRHTAASLLISNGAHAKAIQQLLGHSSISVTFDVYGHLFDADLDALADRLENTYQGTLAAFPRPVRNNSITELGARRA